MNIDDFADSLALIKPPSRLVRVVHRQSDQVKAEFRWPVDDSEEQQNARYFALINAFDPVVHRIEWVTACELEQNLSQQQGGLFSAHPSDDVA